MASPPESKTCPECSHSNPPEVRYCGRCGKYVGDGIQETLTGPPSPPQPEQDAPSLVPGQRFGRRYTIIEEIGRGGMGRVYKAHDQELNIDVALKMIKPALLSSPDIVQRFKKETLLARSLVSENIIRIFDLGEAENTKFISMEYIKGQNLGEMIRAAGRLDVQTAVGIARQACAGMSAAHEKGVIHLDLKPSNLLIDHSGKVRVADFGLAKSLETVDGTLTAAVLGTPAYISPEAAEGKATDHRSDIYALGIILYEMVTGQRPFESQTAAGYLQQHIHGKPTPPSSLNPQVPASLEKIILKCLEKSPGRRYASAGELQAALGLEPQRPLTPAKAVHKRRWVKAARLAAGIMLLAVAAFLGWHFLRSAGGKRMSLAVMVFENKTGDANLDYLRQTLSLQVIQDLMSSRHIRVVTGDMLLRILSELQLADKPFFSVGDLQEVARKLKAAYLLHGSFSRKGETVQVETMLSEVNSWALRGSHQFQCSGLDGLNTLVDSLTRRLKSDLNLSRREIERDIDPQVGLITTSSPEALRLYTNAKDLYNRRMFGPSNEALEKAVALDPRFALAYWGMAENYTYLGRTDRAKEFLEKALSLKDRISPREQALIEGLQASIFKDNAWEAVEHYRKLLKLYPDDTEGNLYLGSLYRNLEEWDLAQERFENALETTSQEEPALVNLVYIAMSKGLYDKALDILQGHREELSKSFYRDFSFNIYLCRNEPDSALAQLSETEGEDETPVLIEKTIAFIIKGELGAANALLAELASATDPAAQLDLRLLRTHLALLEGKYGEARACAQDGVETSRLSGRKVWESRFLLVLSYLDLRQNNCKSSGRYAEEARKAAGEAYALDFQEEALFSLSLANLKCGQVEAFDAGAEELRKLVEKSGIRKHRLYYYFLLGLSARQKGQFRQALDYDEMALTLLPAQRNWLDQQGRWLDLVASAAYQGENFERARQAYEQIQGLTVGRLQWGDVYSLSFYWLGKTFQRLGERDKARQNFREFLRLWENADPSQPEKADAQKQLASLV